MGRALDNLFGVILWLFILIRIAAPYWLPVVMLILGIWLGMKIGYD